MTMNHQRLGSRKANTAQVLLMMLLSSTSHLSVQAWTTPKSSNMPRSKTNHPTTITSFAPTSLSASTLHSPNDDHNAKDSSLSSIFKSFSAAAFLSAGLILCDPTGAQAAVMDDATPIITSTMQQQQQSRSSEAVQSLVSPSLLFEMQSTFVAEDPLPQGWNAFQDPSSGRTYYANEITGESTWDRPETTTTTVAPSPSPSPSPDTNSDLPSGWAAYVDPGSGRTYYSNQSTGESTWDKPAMTTTPSPAPVEDIKDLMQEGRDLVKEMKADMKDDAKEEKETQALIAELEKRQQQIAIMEEQTQKLIDKLEETEERVAAETTALIEKVEKMEEDSEKLGMPILPEPKATSREQAARQSQQETKEFIQTLKARSEENQDLIAVLKERSKKYQNEKTGKYNAMTKDEFLKNREESLFNSPNPAQKLKKVVEEEVEREEEILLGKRVDDEVLLQKLKQREEKSEEFENAMGGFMNKVQSNIK